MSAFGRALGVAATTSTLGLVALRRRRHPVASGHLVYALPTAGILVGLATTISLLAIRGSHFASTASRERDPADQA